MEFPKFTKRALEVVTFMNLYFGTQTVKKEIRIKKFKKN